MEVAQKNDFLRLLKKSRLLTAEQRLEAKSLCQGLAGARESADVLVERGLLTPWQSAQLLLGRTQFHLGKYKLLKFRGRGAMGVVFKAEHPELKRAVAVKVLSKSLLHKPRSVSRFLREIRSTAVLNHPNLVTAYDADQVGNTYCLIMEYLSGRSLKAICDQQERLPVLWSCECARQAALALEHIHERGLVHRDVKPSNLLVCIDKSDVRRPHVKLLDIGLARFVSETEEDGGLTRDGQIVGTGDFMAPEQVAHAKKADIRADIYGLGATLYQLLTGAPPLMGTTLLQTYVNRLQQEPPLVSSRRPEVPAGLDFVVAKMLKRDLAERYQTPREVAADLASILAGAPVDSLNCVVGNGSPVALTADSSKIGFPFGLDEFSPAFALPSGGRSDSISDGSISGFGQFLEGASSSDVSGDGSLCEFLDLVKSDSGAASGGLGARLCKEPQQDRFRSFTANASRMVSNLLSRFRRVDPQAHSAGRHRRTSQAAKASRSVAKGNGAKGNGTKGHGAKGHGAKRKNPAGTD